MANIGFVHGVLLILVIVEASTAACPIGCTCQTEITCNGLASLPSSDDLFSVNKDTVEAVSITDSAGITEIPEDYFVGLPKLTTVTLSNNGLTSLSLNSFKFLPMLTTIDLSGNPIECEENIHWIKEWLAAGGSNVIKGTCPNVDNTPTIADRTDFFPDMDPERLTFEKDEVIEINEDIGTTSVRVHRINDSYALIAKVVTVLHDGTTLDDVIVNETELTFPAAHLYQHININVVDNTVYNSEARGFTITVYAESIAVSQAKGSFSIIDNEVEPTGPEKSPTEAPSDTDKNDKTDENGGGSKAWIIILVIVIIIVVIVVGVFLWKRMQDRKRTTAKDQNVGYSAVKPEGDAKVYSPTTEEVA